MRKFWGIGAGHVCLCTTEADDRDVIAIGAIPDGRDEGKIVLINNQRRIIKRAGNDAEIPFPEKFYTQADVESMHWEVCRIGTHRQPGHEDHA